MKNIFWNSKKNTLRGSGVNLILTFTILILIVFGAFMERVADNLVKIYPMVNMYYVTSIGVWTYKKVKEGFKDEE
jgi:hypothetical protein